MFPATCDRGTPPPSKPTRPPDAAISLSGKTGPIGLGVKGLTGSSELGKIGPSSLDKLPTISNYKLSSAAIVGASSEEYPKYSKVSILFHHHEGPALSPSISSI